MPLVVRLRPLFPGDTDRHIVTSSSLPVSGHAAAEHTSGRERQSADLAADSESVEAPPFSARIQGGLTALDAAGGVSGVEPAAPVTAVGVADPAAPPAVDHADAHTELPIGACVRLTGLKARSELNGQLAHVIGPLMASCGQPGERCRSTPPST